MQPNRRHYLLSHVARHNTLPHGTTIVEVCEMEALINQIGLRAKTAPVEPPASDIDERVRRRDTVQRYQLTSAGWAAIERLGRDALAQKTAS